MKVQIAALNARLAQHAQHAEQLLAGTEAFFGDKAGTIIGQPLEEEDSDSDMSFTSAQERAFSRPLSAGSSYSSAHSKDLSARSRYPSCYTYSFRQASKVHCHCALQQNAAVSLSNSSSGLLSMDSSEQVTDTVHLQVLHFDQQSPAKSQTALGPCVIC